MCEESALYEKLIRSIEKVNQEQTKELKDYINKEVQGIKEKIQEEAQKRIELENKYSELNAKYTLLEKALKKNNIVIFGIPTDKVENISAFTILKLNNILELDLHAEDINNIYTIGKQQARPIVVQFVSYLKKIEVLKNCKKLKGTGISISQDLNLEERKQVKILRHHLKRAREQNQNAYIRGNRLYVNEEVYTAEQLQETEQDVILENNIDISKEKEVKSAPSTPTIRKRQDIEQEFLEEEDTQPDPKKKKSQPTIVIKSSARLASKPK